MSTAQQKPGQPADWLRDAVITIPDFPKPGILFRDLAPIWRSAADTSRCAVALADGLDNVDVIAGLEARGFLTGMITAQRLGVGFVTVRKPGKLAGDVLSVDYALEYGSDTIELQADAIQPGERVAIVDDVIATGGTAAAAAKLIEQAGGEVVYIKAVLELVGLGGREALSGYNVSALWEVTD